MITKADIDRCVRSDADGYCACGIGGTQPGCGCIEADAMQAEIKRLALRGLEAMWRPIGTAPEGVRVMVANNTWTTCGTFEDGRWVIDRDDPKWWKFKPTHWQPLPAAPEVG